MFDNVPRAACREPYPVRRLGRDDTVALADFVLGLDAPALARRFHRHMTPELVRAHYGSLDWDNTIALVWTVDHTIRGLCEVLIYRAEGRVEAEIALSVGTAWRGRGIGRILFARAIDAAAERGAARSLVLLHPNDCTQARIVRALGGTIDRDLQLAIFIH